MNYYALSKPIPRILPRIFYGKSPLSYSKNYFICSNHPLTNMKTRFHYPFLIFLLLTCQYVYSQGLQLYKKGPGAPDDAIREFTKNIALADGSVVFAGQSDEGTTVEISLTKTDATGNIIWQKIIVHDGLDVVDNLCQTADGGFALVGYSESASGLDIDGFVVKLSAQGAFEWSKRIATPDDDEAFGVASMENGDIVVAGASFVGLGNRAGFAARFSQTGTLVWIKSYLQANFTAFRSVLPTSNNGAILCGYSWALGGNSSLFDPFFVQVDNQGEIIWARKKKQAGSQVLYDFKKDLDGGVLYAGVTSTAGANLNVIGKINSSGEHQWAKTFGTPNGSRIWDMAVLSSGDIVAVGFTNKNSLPSSRRNGFISKIGTTGNVLESVEFGSTDTSTTTFTGVSISGNYLISNALTYGFGNPLGACLVAKLPTASLFDNCQGTSLSMSSNDFLTADSTGAENGEPANVSEENGISIIDNDLVLEPVCTITSIENLALNQQIEGFPNPAKDLFQIRNLGNDKKSFQVFSMQGILIKTIESSSTEVGISIKDYPNGLYKILIKSPLRSTVVTCLKE